MRSFRLSPETFEDLTRIAEWRAARDHKPVNLTTSLAWAVSQGVEGIAKIEGQAEALPDNVRDQLFKVAKVTEALAQQLALDRPVCGRACDTWEGPCGGERRTTGPRS